MYALSMTAAGLTTGLAFAAAGAGVSALWPGMTLPLAIALGVAALVYSLHELELLRLPVPGPGWQTPNEWVRGGFYRSAIIFGGTVGFGVFTRVPFATLPILLAWIFVSGNILYGVTAGLVYGAARALSIYSSAWTRAPEEVADLNQRLMQFAPLAHLASSLALATFGAYLLAAPYLS